MHKTVSIIILPILVIASGTKSNTIPALNYVYKEHMLHPMKNLFVITLFFTLSLCFAQKGRDISVSPFIDGTVLVPTDLENPPLVIIIGGSGPTDRNGNQQMVENNSLRYLAEELHENGIASFRYDKRILKQMKDRTLNEESIRLTDFITDAKESINFFKKGGDFSKIFVLGHSQGSLVGMVAAQDLADGFISLAGAGQSIDDVIVAQLEKQAPGLAENGRNAFNELRANGNTTNYSAGLSSIFRPSIQPFIYSWMAFDPKVEIALLDMPVLIINGDKDLQVHPSEAELLKNAKPSAALYIIPKMNHILKVIEGDDMENQKSYNDYRQPVSQVLIEKISTFIKN